MTSPGFSNIFALYQKALSASVIEYFQKQIKIRIRRGIYSAQVVLWLMMLQRLHAVGTLSAAVQLLIQGVAEPLVQDCERRRKGRISSRTGGYCQARHKLPVVLCRQVSREISERLRQMLCPQNPDAPRAYLLDGSSLELEHSRELVRTYPPAKNQHGTSHWPVLRMLVLHELESGLAEEPQWGAMYGADAVSEQELAGKAMDRLPAQSVIVGDRNFGILWVAHEAGKRSLQVVLRLTEARARKLLGGPISHEDEYRVEWKASRWDGGKHHRLPATAEVEGRLIAVRVGRGKPKQWLYLFTTLDWAKERIVELYGRRWNIETDLRSLKRTVRLHHLSVKSKDMLEKELLMAVAAYNLVRAVMSLAARRNNVDPRQLSFAMVFNVVDCAWHKLSAAATKEEFDREFLRVLDLAGQCRLPKRESHRSYPRLLWRRQPGFPFRKGEKTK